MSAAAGAAATAVATGAAEGGAATTAAAGSTAAAGTTATAAGLAFTIQPRLIAAGVLLVAIPWRAGGADEDRQLGDAAAIPVAATPRRRRGLRRAAGRRAPDLRVRPLRYLCRRRPASSSDDSGDFEMDDTGRRRRIMHGDL